MSHKAQCILVFTIKDHEWTQLFNVLLNGITKMCNGHHIISMLKLAMLIQTKHLNVIFDILHKIISKTIMIPVNHLPTFSKPI